MNNSKGLKNTKLKVLLAIVLFLVFTGVLSFALYWPFGSIYANSNRYDMAFVGASQVRRGINPEIIDKKLGTNSCDYSCAGCMSEGKYSMLKSALEQESLKTVVLDMSYFAISKKYEDYVFEEKILYFPRISGIFNKAEVAARDFSFAEDDYDQLYAELLYEGSDDWRKIVKGTYAKYKARKGYSPRRVNDLQIKSEKKMKALYNCDHLTTDYPEYNLRVLGDAINLCKENNVKVLLITIPVSQKFLWMSDGLDYFHEQMLAFAEEYEVEYYDFNLMQGLNKHFSDSESFYDIEHLSRIGAKEFSKILANVLKASAEQKTSTYEFYDTYTEAKKHLDYSYVLEQ